MSNEISIDLSAVEAEVGKLTREQIEAELLKVRTRQKVQQKKNQGSDKQKAYALKQRARIKLLTEMAKKGGYYDAVNAKAEEQADEKLLDMATEPEGNEAEA